MDQACSTSESLDPLRTAAGASGAGPRQGGSAMVHGPIDRRRRGVRAAGRAPVLAAPCVVRLAAARRRRGPGGHPGRLADAGAPGAPAPPGDRRGGRHGCAPRGRGPPGGTCPAPRAHGPRVGAVGPAARGGVGLPGWPQSRAFPRLSGAGVGRPLLAPALARTGGWERGGAGPGCGSRAAPAGGAGGRP